MNEVYVRHMSLQWHVVFLGKEWKRMWARDGFIRFKEFELDFDNWFESDKREVLRFRVKRRRSGRML